MKRYKNKIQESFIINNKDAALLAIEQGIEYIYSLFTDMGIKKIYGKI